MTNVCNGTIDQLKSVASVCRFPLIGEASQVKSPVEPITAAVARKNATGAIGAVRSRCQPNNQQLRLCVAKIGNRFPPVLLIDECPPFGLSDFLAVADQSGTCIAVNNGLIELVPASGMNRRVGNHFLGVNRLEMAVSIVEYVNLNDASVKRWGTTF